MDAPINPPRRGRPALVPGQPATETICIRVTPEVGDVLLRVGEENHTTRADVIREAVNEYVTDYRERPVFHQMKRQITESHTG